ATMSALIDHTRLDFSGCSVTVPHKQHLVRLAREAGQSATRGDGDGIAWTVDAISDICGAANTLKVDRDAAGRPVRAHAFNTDAAAAAACLADAIGPLRGVRIGLLGAGGAARAIAAGLLAEGAEVVIFNRTSANAERLVEELNASRQGRIASGK